jgi:hypothetical protein
LPFYNSRAGGKISRSQNSTVVSRTNGSYDGVIVPLKVLNVKGISLHLFELGDPPLTEATLAILISPVAVKLQLSILCEIEEY